MELVTDGDRRRQTLDKIRADRAKTLEDIEAVKEAPLSADDTAARLLARLVEEADRTQHRVLAFAQPGLSPDDLTLNPGLLLWLYGADFERYLRARLKTLLPATAMPQAERTKKLASLRARLAALDEAEEREICRLEGQGLAADRRIDVELAVVEKVWDSLDAGATQS